MVCGFHKPPIEWNLNQNSGEYRNAGSIVVRLEYKGKSILFYGDTVGRHIGDPDDTCIAAEKFMVDNIPVIKIASNIIIAPHHGADNANSKRFIKAVNPQYVIFSVGHKHEHPRAAAVNRYLTSGVSQDNVFRTDRGDDEGEKEWNDEYRQQGHIDPAGDDDVDMLIRGDGSIIIAYRN